MGDAKNGAEGREPLAVTTFRITQRQWNWLRQNALERAVARGYGKADASEVLRDLLDGQLARGQ